MNVSLIVYLSEIAILMTTIIIGFIFYEGKRKEGYIKFLGISIAIYIIIASLTFVFEIPQIDVNIEQIEAKSTQQIEEIIAKYHFTDVSDKVKINGNIDYNKIGEYEIDVEVDTLLGSYKKNVVIKVVDTKKPEIILEGEKDYKQSYSPILL